MSFTYSHRAFPERPNTNTCVWRENGDLDKPVCGKATAVPHSFTCSFHSIAWRQANTGLRRQLKAASDWGMAV